MTDVLAHLSVALADRYRIERPLGEGGMATVYLAQDLKHDRKVALKVLRPSLAAVVGADRFLQEIKTTAQLQHPHILPLYDSGSTTALHGDGPGFLYYVMPYVEGDTLRQKLEREQQLGVDEAVRITSEVADALQYAHEQGVIHRDIKPENILLRGGRAFVADFGIALAVSTATDGRMTETGLSLGTPHYMSPEQATADTHITGRSDIYSLGSVLYELLTGEPPHTGPSAPVIVAKIIADTARPVRAVRKAVPPHIEAAVAMALEKLPADRFETAQAFADALHNPTFSGPVAAAAAAAVRPAERRPAVPLLMVTTVAALAMAAWGWIRPSGERDPDRVVARNVTSLNVSGALDGLNFAVAVALSPDGSALVYRSPLVGPGQLYLKRRDEVVARPLAGTEGGSGPFFSPDGAWIGFVAGGQLRRVPSNGGASSVLTDSVSVDFNRGAWLDDGSIVFYDWPTRTLRRLVSGESKATVIVSPAKLEGRYPWLPSPLPNARGVLFTAHRTECIGPVSCRPSRVYVYDIRRDTIRTLFDDAIGAWHVPSGHVLYLTSGGTLMAAPWDNDQLVATGRAVPVLDGIQAPGFQVANDGTAYYVLGRTEFAPGPVPNAQVVWVDRRGRIEPVDSSWQVNTGGGYEDDTPADWGVALSPDGRRLALSLLTDKGTDVWIKTLPSGPATRLTLYAGMDRGPSWTADGRAVRFLSDRPVSPLSPSGETTSAKGQLHVWEQAADGSGDAHLVWRRDGQLTLYSMQASVDSVVRAMAKPGAEIRGATLSPDGRWLAYVSNEQGPYEVFVRPFPNVNGGKWQVSNGGGGAPLWAHSGRELFYATRSAMFSVRLTLGASVVAEPPRALFPIGDELRGGALSGGTIALSPDDQRFLMVRDNRWQDMAGTSTLVVVQNFLTELRGKITP